MAITVIFVFLLAACSAEDRRSSTPKIADQSLPSAMKGYELYSWYSDKEGAWYFTLISGTNRIKTYQEIVEAPNTETSDGWVKITVNGVESLKLLLARLPRGTEVAWLGPGWLKEIGAGEEILDAVAMLEGAELDQLTVYCRELGVNLDIVD